MTKYEALIVEAGLVSIHLICCDQRPACPICNMLIDALTEFETLSDEAQSIGIQHVISKVIQHGCFRTFLRELDKIEKAEAKSETMLA